jgi:methylenetetrahydrofolate dehydrogenase (NAD+)
MASSNPELKIDAAQIALPFRSEVRELISKLPKPPRLVGLLGQNDEGAKKYAEWTKKACVEDGIDFVLITVDKMGLETELEKANRDPDVHGIMIYYPCFGNKPSFYGGSQDDYLRDSVRIEKDVEGLCHTYRHNLYHNVRHLDAEATVKSILPCTPLALVKVVEYLGLYNRELPHGEQLQGKVITIINRSEIVGRPVAAMLANDGAEVYSVDIDSVWRMQRGKIEDMETGFGVEEAVRKSDVIITGVPVKTYRLNIEWVPPSAAVVNFSHFKNVDEADLLAKGCRYVPLVGKVTVSMLERNLVRLFYNFVLKKPMV